MQPVLPSLDYVAGIMDGEGHFGITKTFPKEGQFRYYARAAITSQSIKMLTLVQQVIGGKVIDHITQGTPNNRARPNHCYRLEFSPRMAVELAKKLLNHLIIKREQAELVILLHRQIDSDGFRGHKRGSPKGMRRTTAEALAWREALYLQMKELNHRDSEECRKIWANSVNTLERAIPSQAVEGEESTEGVTTRAFGPN